MLRIIVPGVEMYDPTTQRFVEPPDTELELEHSLVSVSKWESKWEIPYLDDTVKTDAQTIDYVRCMITSGEIPDETMNRLTKSNYTEISEYIGKKMTATWFSNKAKPGPKNIVTAELVYYWITTYRIPYEVQYWHLNRLLTLINVFSEKNKPEKKLSKGELAARNRELNRQRIAKSGGNG